MTASKILHVMCVTMIIVVLSDMASGFGIGYSGLDRIGKLNRPPIIEKRDFGDQEWYSCYIPSLNPCVPAGSGQQTGRCPDDGVSRDDITSGPDDDREFNGNVKKYGYHYPAINPSRFIQCDDFGCCFYKKCRAGQVWNQGSKTCVAQ